MVVMAQVEMVVVVMIEAASAIHFIFPKLPIPTGQRRAKDGGGNVLRIGDSDRSNMSMVMEEVLVR